MTHEDRHVTPAEPVEDVVDEHPGVGMDGSLHSTHDRDDEPHEGVGTDGSLHSTTAETDDNRSD
jgi:hypothetical protein